MAPGALMRVGHSAKDDRISHMIGDKAPEQAGVPREQQVHIAEQCGVGETEATGPPDHVNAFLAHEEQRCIAIDRRAADGASLNITSRLKRFPKCRHARLSHEQNEGAERNISPDGFAVLNPDGSKIRHRYAYCGGAPLQRNSLLKIDADAAG